MRYRVQYYATKLVGDPRLKKTKLQTSITFDSLQDAYYYFKDLEDDIYILNGFETQPFRIIDENDEEVILVPTKDGKHLEMLAPSYLDIY